MNPCTYTIKSKSNLQVVDGFFKRRYTGFGYDFTVGDCSRYHYLLHFYSRFWIDHYGWSVPTEWRQAYKIASEIYKWQWEVAPILRISVPKLYRRITEPRRALLQ